MDIAKINELLIENEKIKAKIVEIKRKLNLKNYTQTQKQEFIKILKMLRDIIALNQEKCVTLSKIKAGKFANIVCRVLNKEYGYQYEVKTVALKYPYNSMRMAMARAYNNETGAAFLVVKSRKVKKNEEVSLNDKTLLPIAYLSGYYGDDCFDEYTDLLLEQQEINLFEYETLETLLFDKDMKMFNFGVASKNETLENDILKLRESVKKEMGILTKQELKVQKQEKQL